MPEIVFDHVNVSFDDTPVLQDINLRLTEQRIGIIGANGGGKSTLIRLINGLGSADSGTVTFNGMDINKEGAKIRQQVGFVFSDAENQIIMPSVQEDVEFSLRRHKLSKAERQRRVAATLARFNLTEHAQKSPHVLSGGQKQLLALASILVIEPATIICDEPTTLLDLRNRQQIKKIFQSLDQQLLVVSHDLDFLADFDRVICIDNHQVIADGLPGEVIPFYCELISNEQAENHG